MRSAGGWDAVRSLRKAGLFQKSDERILGDGDFVETVLSKTREHMQYRYHLASKGIGFDDIVDGVSKKLSVQPQKLEGPCKERIVVKARSLVCYWAVRDLGRSMTEISRRLDIALSTVSAAVKKGRRIVQDEGLDLVEVLNVDV